MTGFRIGLAALFVILCGVIGLEISASDVSVPLPSALTAGTVANREQAPAVAQLDQHDASLRQILSRPLFSPSRRPIEAGTRGLPRLTGIMVSDSQRVAIFAASSGERPIVAQAGARVGAYEVQEITDSGVTVLGPGGITMIRPAFDPAKPAGPTAAAPAARPPVGRPTK